jgi:hypothetical protein
VLGFDEPAQDRPIRRRAPEEEDALHCGRSTNRRTVSSSVDS